jgi:hypothetical protein
MACGTAVDARQSNLGQVCFLTIIENLPGEPSVKSEPVAQFRRPLLGKFCNALSCALFGRPTSQVMRLEVPHVECVRKGVIDALRLRYKEGLEKAWIQADAVKARLQEGAGGSTRSQRIG